MSFNREKISTNLKRFVNPCPYYQNQLESNHSCNLSKIFTSIRYINMLGKSQVEEILMN